MTSAASDILLKTVDLTAGYPGWNLFKNLDLPLCGGQLVCFMGPNGSGKSTLIRTISGLQDPVNGHIEVQGQKVLSSKLKEQIALVLTETVRAGYMTVQELVAFGRYPFLNWTLKLSDKDREIIEHSINVVNISHLRFRRLNELSDGQRQMAMIARALAQETPILILDEPTAHLDLNNRVEIMRMLQKLTRDTGKAVLMATHELDLALQTADLIWLAGESENILTGVPEELVLSGAFDEIFRFKGFDLKTGRVQHEAFRGRKINLFGEGHYYLWTRNFLERNGFEVTATEGTEITINITSKKSSWLVNTTHQFDRLGDLLIHLQKCC